MSFQHHLVPTIGINFALTSAEISTDFSGSESGLQVGVGCLPLRSLLPAAEIRTTFGELRYMGQVPLSFAPLKAASHRCRHFYLLHPKLWGSQELLLRTYLLPFDVSAK